MTAPSPVPYPDLVEVHPGPALLHGLGHGPSLGAHRARYGDLPEVDALVLRALTHEADVRGRGGAAFPFATKLDGVRKHSSPFNRPVVVVNLSEGEPASSKDSALALVRPHLVLDGAVATARALRASVVHVVLPGERALPARQMTTAVGERDENEDGVAIELHTAEPRFVAGQASAVIELLSGRRNLPVTAWQPAAFDGLDGRPTLLSNAETWAHVGLLVLRGAAAYRARGNAAEPGTTLLTVTGPDGRPHVHEVEFGTRLREVLPGDAADGAVLLGGFHGAWATWPTAASARVSVPGMRSLGLPLGAGVVLAPGRDACPLSWTSRIVDHLAGQSARRCGPCFNGLPALASAVRALHDGSGPSAEAERLAGLVAGRGACAHPDGTVRLVRSLLTTMRAEVLAHRAGACLRRPLELAS